MHNTRLDILADYPFERLAALLADLTPPEGPTVALSVGEPHHPPPPIVTEILAANEAGWGRYPPTPGTPQFRAAVAGWLNRRYALPDGMIDADRHIIPVSGTREALYLAAQVACPPERRGGPPLIAMPNPFYQVYLGAAVLAGGEPLLLSADASNGFLPDYASLSPAVFDRMAMATICSPANPQGAVASRAYLAELVRLARKHDFVLCSDECYSEIHGGATMRDGPPGVLEVCAEMGGSLDNVLVFNSLSKRSSVPGLRSGFVAGDPRLIALFTRLRFYGGAPLPLPVAAVSIALWSDETHVEANRALYQAKFAIAEDLLGPRFGPVTPPGGFFLWLDVGDGEATARRLWEKGAIRVLPGVYLARPGADRRNPAAGYIRVALVDDLASTRRALERIAPLL